MKTYELDSNLTAAFSDNSKICFSYDIQNKLAANQFSASFFL